ncbi:MAG: hypothetical protein RL094_528 [Candidatus Parcubacteria bacterium]|jgi:hypothetical protein
MKKRGALIFYVGNGVVKAAVIQKEKVSRPHVAGFERRELPYLDTTDRAQLESRVNTELNELCLDIKKNILTKPECSNIAIKEAIVLFSSPWYVSQTKNIHVTQEKPFIVTQQLIDNAILDASSAYTGKGSREFRIIEQKLIKVSLNGYPTQSPEKKKATILDLSVFLSFARVASIDQIKSTIEKHFHLSDISVHSQSLASFSVIQKMWSDHPNYIISDVTSEITELLIVRQNALSEAASFPMGKQYVVRELTRILNTTGEVSNSLLAMYQEKRLDIKLVDKIEKAMAEIKTNWLQSFTKTLGDMTIGTALPSKFYLFCPKDIVWLFSDFIKSEEYQQFSFSEGQFEVYDVKVADLAEHCTWEPSIEKDLSITIGAVYNFHL